MLINRELAQTLCSELGITWDSEAMIPTLRGQSTAKEHVEELFSSCLSEECCIGLTFSLSRSKYNVYGSVDLKCA